MNCKICNTENNNESKFCIRCGASLLSNEVVKPEPSLATPIKTLESQVREEQETYVEQPQVREEQETYVEQPQVREVQQLYVTEPRLEQAAPVSDAKQMNIWDNLLSYILYVIAVLIKPFTAYKEQNKFNDTKETLIFGGVVAIAMTAIDFIKALISGLFVETLDYSTFETKTKVDFANLKNLDYFGLIFKNLLIYAGIIVAIALVYYLVALIFKKSLKFTKLISITATSSLPYIVLGMIASPILGKIWMPLSIISFIVGTIYSVVILVNLINEEIKFTNIDLKIYYHTICISTLIITAGFVVYQIIVGILSSGLGGILNSLG